MLDPSQIVDYDPVPEIISFNFILTKFSGFVGIYKIMDTDAICFAHGLETTP